METPVIKIASRIEQRDSAGQDRLEINHHGNSTTVVIADGAGGTSGGEEAANYIVSTLSEKSYPQVGVVLMDVILGIDSHLINSERMGESTVVLISFEGHQFTGVVAGDSEVYFYSLGKLTNLAEHKQPKPLLGSTGCIPAVFQGELGSGRLLACSDGLWKYINRENIISNLALPDVEESADALLNAIRLPSGQVQDDVSFVLVD